MLFGLTLKQILCFHPEYETIGPGRVRCPHCKSVFDNHR